MERKDPTAELKRLGQRVWLDQLGRTMIRSGKLAQFRAAGVTGVTVTPTTFAKALESSATTRTTWPGGSTEARTGRRFCGTCWSRTSALPPTCCGQYSTGSEAETASSA